MGHAARQPGRRPRRRAGSRDARPPRYDYASADGRYARLSADTASTDLYAIYALIGAGQGLDTRGHLGEAGERLGRARAAAHRRGDRWAEGEALLAQAFIRAQAEGVAAGFAILDTVNRLLPPSALATRAALLGRRSGLFAISGQGDSAAALSIACRDLARRAGEPRTEATCLRAQAYSLSAQNRADSALAILAQVERLQRDAHDHGGLAITLLFATDPYLNTGRYGAAKAMLERALVEAERSHDDNSIAAVHLGLGSLGIRFADYVSADAELREAAQMFSEQGDTNDATNAVSFQAYLAAATGDLARARAQYAQVIAWQQRIGNVRAEYDDRLQLAEIELRAGDVPAAATTLSAARRLARRTEQPRWLTELGYEEGRLAMVQGDLATAKQRLDEYIRTRDSTEHLQRHLGRTRLAEVYAMSGDVERAEHELTAAGDELDHWRASLADPDLRVLAFQASAGDHRSRDASVARVLAAMVQAGRAAPAFELAERRRARELVDRLTQAEALRTDSAPTASASAPLRREPVAITAAAASAALPDSLTALIEYVTGLDGAPTSVFVVTRDGRAGSRPARRRLRAAIHRPIRRPARGRPGSPRAIRGARPRAARPGAGLLAPTVDRLLVVPDGPLHRLAFDALRLPDGRLVVERYTVALAPSAGALATLRTRPARAERAGGAMLLALGDPAFAREQGDRTARGELFRDAFDRSGGLPRLAAAGDEVRDVARYAPEAVVRVRGDASEAFLKRAPLDAIRHPPLRDPRPGGRSDPGPHRARAGARRGRGWVPLARGPGRAPPRCRPRGALGVPDRGRRHRGGRGLAGTDRARCSRPERDPWSRRNGASGIAAPSSWWTGSTRRWRKGCRWRMPCVRPSWRPCGMARRRETGLRLPWSEIRTFACRSRGRRQVPRCSGWARQAWRSSWVVSSSAAGHAIRDGEPSAG